MVRKQTATLQRSALRILDKIVRIEFVNRNENVVPLYCKNEGGLRATLIPLFAKINSNNCYL